jgi:hypothetical protein
LKKLGNAATHPNDGDVEKQEGLDRELVIQVRAAFEELLDTIYERPAKAAARQQQLSEAVEAITGS